MNTLDKLRDLIDRVFEGEIDSRSLTLSSRLREDMGMTSIGMLYMAMSMEEEFGLNFSNEDFAGMTTVADVVACIEA